MLLKTASTYHVQFNQSDQGWKFYHHIGLNCKWRIVKRTLTDEVCYER